MGTHCKSWKDTPGNWGKRKEIRTRYIKRRGRGKTRNKATNGL